MADKVRAVQLGARQIEVREFDRPEMGPDNGLVRIEHKAGPPSYSGAAASC